jgi:hypothetical protein
MPAIAASCQAAHFAKQPGEPKRMQPSRARNDSPQIAACAQRSAAS